MGHLISDHKSRGNVTALMVPAMTRVNTIGFAGDAKSRLLAFADSNESLSYE